MDEASVPFLQSGHSHNILSHSIQSRKIVTTLFGAVVAIQSFPVVLLALISRCLLLEEVLYPIQVCLPRHMPFPSSPSQKILHDFRGSEGPFCSNGLPSKCPSVRPIGICELQDELFQMQS